MKSSKDKYPGCRCPVGRCLLHPSATTCSLRLPPTPDAASRLTETKLPSSPAGETADDRLEKFIKGKLDEMFPDPLGADISGPKGSGGAAPEAGVPKSSSYHEHLIQALRDPTEAISYLQAACDEGIEDFRKALLNVAESHLAAPIAAAAQEFERREAKWANDFRRMENRMSRWLDRAEKAQELVQELVDGLKLVQLALADKDLDAVPTWTRMRFWLNQRDIYNGDLQEHRVTLAVVEQLLARAERKEGEAKHGD